jgi:TolB protein
MKNIVYRYSLLCSLGLLTFVPLTGIVSPDSSSSQLSPSVGQNQVSRKPASSTKQYKNSTYGVSLSYPSNWRRTKGYEDRERFSGADGFFLVSALSSPSPSTIQNVCNDALNHRLNPYGTRPQVQRLQIQGRPACLILPSSDQDPAMERIATLIVRYPTPIRLNGANYNHLTLSANKEHIRQITNGLRFTIPRR